MKYRHIVYKIYILFWYYITIVLQSISLIPQSIITKSWIFNCLSLFEFLKAIVNKRIANIDNIHDSTDVSDLNNCDYDGEDQNDSDYPFW